MQKEIITKQISILLFVLAGLGSIVLTSFKSNQDALPDTKSISNSIKVLFKPKNYYLSAVLDGRLDKKIGLQTVKRQPGNIKVSEEATIKGGAPAAIKQYVDEVVFKNKELKPVVITLKEYSIKETITANGSVDGQVKLRLSFSLLKEYGLAHLLDYQGGLHYVRANNSSEINERDLKAIVKSGLSYFDNWMDTYADSDEKLASTVSLRFSDFQDEAEGDTIYYSSSRPLKWSDFQSKNRPKGNYAAMVMPGLAYEVDAKLVKGNIQVNIAVKAFLPKSMCWVGHDARTAYTLNHEQRHFDVAKIIAERFKQQLLSKKLNPDNYEAAINMQYLDAYREMNAMQKAYDHETRHGIDQLAQSMWNLKIDKQLKTSRNLH